MLRIVALYENLSDVEPVIGDLVAAGVARDGITVVANTDEHQAFRRAAQSGDAPGAAVAATGPDSHAGHGDEDFLGWLFGGGTPPWDATAYQRGVESGGKLISVDVADTVHDRVVTILERHGAVDIDKRARRSEPGAAGAGEGIVAGGTAATPAPPAASTRPDVGEDGIATSDHVSGVAGSSGSLGGAAPLGDGEGRSIAGSWRVRSYAVESLAVPPQAVMASDLAMAGNKPGARIAGLAPEEIDGGANRSYRR